MTDTILLPGQSIATADTTSPGAGTHVSGSSVIASLAGVLSPSSSPNSTTKTSPGSAKPATLAIKRHSVTTTQTTNALPTIDSKVLARVTRLSVRQAVVEILVIEDKVCREGFQGIIRREDVRSTEKDRVVVSESFRVGDIVRGVVISLGDQSSYYLSTASNELGVMMATSEAGNQMYPISWKEFKDPKTGRVESRKCAKPF